MTESTELGLRPVQTAGSGNTVWSRISQDDFREHLVALEKQTNGVPIDPTTEEVSDTTSFHVYLPVRVEKQVADDLAYIAAVSEGAQSVAAVCLEQHARSADDDGSQVTLIIKVAGMDVVNDRVKDILSQVTEILQKVSQQDESTHRTAAVDNIFRLIIRQHEGKLLGRLRSKKWTKPTYLDRTHKKSLAQDFANLLHRVQHIYPKKSERKVREATSAHLLQLAKAYNDFEESDAEIEIDLQTLVKTTFASCRVLEIREYASNLENVSATPQVAAALKTLRQLEKVGAYWRISQDLVATAASFPAMLAKIQLEYVRPYASVPTEITYESWAGKCHVHAEVQLVVEQALAQKTSNSAVFDKPRVIGTSKYLCYLCYLFLRSFGGFELLCTHGRLYDQWTVPDLAEYDTPTREKFAAVLQEMDEHILEQIDKTKGIVWRPEPMTSRQNLLCSTDDDGGMDQPGAGVDKLALK